MHPIECLAVRLNLTMHPIACLAVRLKPILQPIDRLVGLVVKASASRAGGPGFESR